ncbi:hypothetical protein EDB85DRAFT_1885228 [Lactarius pseudohatsudake]|nr:hypothetical protein EDB85DRAFT_1885228 [Lactarius pseudohatsudake]
MPHPQASKVLVAGELLHDTTTPHEGPVATHKPHHDTTLPHAMPPHSPTGDATTSRERPVATPCDRGMQAAPQHHPTPHEATPAQRATYDVARKAHRNAMRSWHASHTTTPPRPARSHPSSMGKPHHNAMTPGNLFTFLAGTSWNQLKKQCVKTLMTTVPHSVLSDTLTASTARSLLPCASHISPQYLLIHCTGPVQYCRAYQDTKVFPTAASCGQPPMGGPIPDLVLDASGGTSGVDRKTRPHSKKGN